MILAIQNNSGRYADSQAAGRNIRKDNGIGANSAVIAKLNAAKNLCASTYYYTTSNSGSCGRAWIKV